jgi:hypothetical protein
MAELFVRVVVLAALVFGVAYGLTRAARSRQQQRLLAELAEAKERLSALRHALSGGDLSQREHDELAERIYERCRECGVPLDDDPPAGAERRKEIDA